MKTCKAQRRIGSLSPLSREGNFTSKIPFLLVIMTKGTMVDDMFALAHNILGWVKHKGGNIPKT
jgi:hypothetical protein